MVAGWRDVCQHVGVGLNPGDLAKFPAVVSVCVCLSVSWLVVTEVVGFAWGGGLVTIRQVSGLLSVGLRVGAPLLKFDEVCFPQRKWPS